MQIKKASESLGAKLFNDSMVLGSLIDFGPIDPLIYYPGNKRVVLPAFSKILPMALDYGGRCYDLFTGSGAFPFGLGYQQIVMNDLNPDVFLMHKVVRDNLQEMIDVLKSLKVEEEHFYEIRDRFNDSEHPLPDIVRAAFLVYLTLTCAGHGYRVNSKGEFNQSFGDRKQSVLMSGCCRARDVSWFLQRPGVELRNLDFESCLYDVKPLDIVYADPPYDESKDGYNAKPFGVEGLERLARKCVELTEMSVCVVVSNYDTPLVRELFPPSLYDIEVVNVKQGIRAQGDNAKNEVVIWNRVRV